MISPITGTYGGLVRQVKCDVKCKQLLGKRREIDDCRNEKIDGELQELSDYSVIH